MNLLELQKKLQPNQAALVLSEENRRYFTEFYTSDGYLIVSAKGSLFLTDSRYIEDAKFRVTACAVALQTDAHEQIDAFLRAKGCTEVLVEASRMTMADLNGFREKHPQLIWNTSGTLDAYIQDFRSRKEVEELVLMTKAQEIAEKSFLETLDYVKEGVLERELAAELEYRIRLNGADGVGFDSIVVSGENSSKPHGVPGMRALLRGDFITFDFGALYQGYRSDTTRTVALGKPSDEMRLVYNTVRKAQEAAVDALHAGITARAYDKVARDIITEAGFGPYFGHSLGHGVGIEIHEEPFCGPRSEAVLQARNVVTSEPGIYLPGKFGVRIEDMLMVTEEGSQNFCKLTKDLIVL